MTRIYLISLFLISFVVFNTQAIVCHDDEVDCQEMRLELCSTPSCIQNPAECAFCGSNIFENIYCPTQTYFFKSVCFPSSNITCPLGTVFSSDLCTEISEISCPMFHTYTNGVCLNDEEYVKCDIDSEECSIPNYSCQKTGNCTLRTECLEDLILYNGGCTSTTVASCPDGFLLQDGTCIRENKCTSLSDCIGTSCPLNATMINGTCIRELDCPKDKYHVNGVCIFCPINSYFYNASCVYCPNGTYLGDGECEENIQCSEKELLINGVCTPIYCYGKYCCKDAECNYCFMYCEKNNIDTSSLSECQERCIKGLSPINVIPGMIIPPNNINQIHTESIPETVIPILPVLTTTAIPPFVIFNVTTAPSLTVVSTPPPIIITIPVPYPVPCNTTHTIHENQPHKGCNQGTNNPLSINITNIVNNTNTENVKTNINNTNINNINMNTHSDSNITLNNSVNDYNGNQEDCCIISSPRKCEKLNYKWKCVYRKYHWCGPECLGNLTSKDFPETGETVNTAGIEDVEETEENEETAEPEYLNSNVPWDPRQPLMPQFPLNTMFTHTIPQNILQPGLFSPHPAVQTYPVNRMTPTSKKHPCVSFQGNRIVWTCDDYP